MSLQDRLAALITAIGADIKAIGNVRTGWGPPTNAIGKVGDYYVDMSNLDVYGPKAAHSPAKVTGLTGQLHNNPSVESNFTGYTASASVPVGNGISERTTDHPQDGSWAYHFKIDRTDSVLSASAVFTSGALLAGGNAVSVDPAKVYSFGLRVYTRVMTNIGTFPGRLRIYWYKADGSASAVATSTLQPSGEAITPVVGTTQDFAFENVTPPSDAGLARVSYYPGSFPASGQGIYEGDLDSVVAVQATEVPKWGAPTGKLVTTSGGGSGSTPSLVTSLPGSPTDGQEVYYLADSTNGVIWHLRYRLASTKWEFLGGSSLYAEDLANRASLNNSPNYGALATAVQVTAPLAGTYEVEYSVSASSTGTNTGFFSDVAVGATVGTDQNAAVTYMNSSTFPRGAVHKKRRITCAAGDVVALVHKAGVTTITAHARTLSLKPVAVS